ncbi:MAG: TPM domain-containing protein [Steroidobacteraceae bacterium]
MHWKRALTHLLATRGDLARAFPPRVLAAIESAIAETERAHSGEIRFAIETSLDPVEALKGRRPRERAVQVFAETGTWDTELNNGVLVYVLLADRAVEIVADRGHNDRVAADEWAAACRAMEAAFREGRYEAGAVEGIRRVGAIVARHYPATPGAANPDELPNRPVLL